MMGLLRRARFERPWWWYALIGAVLLLAAALGYRPSPLWLALPFTVAALLALLRQPVLGLFALILAALLVKLSIGTGTEVTLNTSVLIVPVLIVVWLLVQMNKQTIRLAPSRVNLPLALYLLSGLLSLIVGNAT